MLKKFFILVLALMLVLSACSANEPEVTEVPEDATWDRNFSEHWINGENGEKLNVGEHELDEIWLCSVCGSEIIDWGDGFFDVYNYDDQGNLERHSSYSSDGECIDDYQNIFEYDESGNVIYLKVYQNGSICGESEFSYSSEGWTYESRCTTYYSEGNYTVEEYNENGSNLFFRDFDAEGNLVTESINDFAPDQYGYEYLAKSTTTDYSTGFEYINQYNEHNDLTRIEEYDDAKNLIHDESREYEYDEEGRRSHVKTYLGGVITSEVIFGYAEDESGWWSYYDTEITYSEDGSYTVCKYNENDELLSKVHYDANGNPVE